MKKTTAFLIIGIIAVIIVFSMFIDLLDVIKELDKAEKLLNKYDVIDYSYLLQKMTVNTLQQLKRQQLINMIIPVLFAIVSFILSCSKEELLIAQINKQEQSLHNTQFYANTEPNNYNQQKQREHPIEKIIQEQVTSSDLAPSSSSKEYQCSTCVYQGEIKEKCYIFDVKKEEIINNSINCEFYEKKI
ncbi:MAG: hypothetical protein RR086_03060 [Clostridia bacterium]